MFSPGLGHQRRSLGDLVNPLHKLICLPRLRRPDEIDGLCLVLDHIGGISSGVRDGIVHPRLVYHVLAQEIAADVHKLQGVQGAPSHLGTAGGMGADSVKLIQNLKIRQRAVLVHLIYRGRMPG